MKVRSLRVCLVAIAVLAAACGTQSNESTAPEVTAAEVPADNETSSVQEGAASTETAVAAESTSVPEEPARPTTTGSDGDASTTAPAADTSETTAAPTTAVPTTAAPTTVAPTTEAPAGDFVNLVGGGQLDLNSIEGTDTVLWFWAPW